jgi:hypothetical protein
MKKQLKTAAKLILVAALSLGVLTPAAPVLASGGSGSGGGSGGATIDTIKVIKCEYAVTQAYVELLISASSSNSGASLYAFLPNGTYLGQVQNGAGGRYGGTVFITLFVPDSIILKSSAGGIIDAPCVPYQP